ncbi:MAG: thioredoxin family protein [Desulfovibrio sp.]|nr:thioredoxin family protein [Desulfovibrio sp.]
MVWLLLTASLALAETPQVPVPGMVTMVDLGAKKCIPCKMMAPILEALEKEYDGRAAIVFIDVWEHPNEAEKYNLRSIPTQIFYDAEGKERWRHVGFLEKAVIEAKLQELGVQ